jgi:DNA-binding MarR family transcriptional regulator
MSLHPERPADSDDPALGDVLDFMRLLWDVNHELEAWSKRMDARIGVTGPQRLVIRIVGRFPGISAGRLATVLHVHPSTLTGVLGRLEDRGFVKRSADPADARKALFGLTAQGKRLDTLRSGTVESVVRRVLRDASPGNLTGAQKVLGALATALGDHEPAPVADAPKKKPPRRAREKV